MGQRACHRSESTPRVREHATGQRACQRSEVRGHRIQAVTCYSHSSCTPRAACVASLDFPAAYRYAQKASFCNTPWYKWVFQAPTEAILQNINQSFRPQSAAGEFNPVSPLWSITALSLSHTQSPQQCLHFVEKRTIVRSTFSRVQFWAFKSSSETGIERQKGQQNKKPEILCVCISNQFCVKTTPQ